METFEEASGHVRPERVNKWPNCMTDMMMMMMMNIGHYRVILLTSYSTCGICGGQSGTETVCLQVLLFPLLTIIIDVSYIKYYISEAT
jgi:hypothetical protein